MNKLLVLIFALVISLSAAGCLSDSGGGDGALTGSLEEIMQEIYESGNLSDDFKNNMLPALHTKVITEDEMEMYLGKGGLDIKEAVASEHEMVPPAYSVCLVRVNEGADIENIKQTIKDNVDPFRWICVGVEPENILVDNIGDVIILVMSNIDADNLLEAFLALK